MKRCIVIADDDPIIVSLVSLRLGLARYNVVSTNDAVAAVAMARVREPLAMILDVQMPGGSGSLPGGLAALARIKADPDLRALPVMMLTGERNAETVMQAMNGGAADYMVKPFNPDTLLERVSRMIGKSVPVPAAADAWEI
ncbi:MAG TPA: response regulator [Rhizomicrobium sp.]